MFTNKTISRTIATLSGFTLALGALAGCATTDAQHSAHNNHEHSHSHDTKAPLHAHDLWVKAAAKGEHTAIFGNLHSDLTNEALVITKVTTDAAEKAEIHEVVNGKMQPLNGGLTLAAGDDTDLEPGGNHLMLLHLKQDLRAGDSVKFTLHLENGETVPFEALVRDYSGANENYDHSGHGHDHDHDSHGNDGHNHDHDNHDHGDSESGHDH